MSIDRKACGCQYEDGALVRPCPDGDVPTIVGRRPCGCCGFAAVVDGEKSDADHYAEAANLVKLGWSIEHRTVAWVRHTSGEDGGLRFNCPHGKPKRQRRAAR